MTKPLTAEQKAQRAAARAVSRRLKSGSAEDAMIAHATPKTSAKKATFDKGDIVRVGNGKTEWRVLWTFDDGKIALCKATTKVDPTKSISYDPAKLTLVRHAAKSTKKASTKSVEKLSTESDAIPSDPAELKQLVKITRDRRWRAGRRGDETLVKQMDKRLAKLLAASAK